MKSEEVSWALGKTIVGGTITSPEKSGSYPGVVFVAGSGPTDRNWESPLLPGTNGTARLLAEQLTPKGYVTLRYDKRVAGPHAKQNLPALIGHISMQSHFEELKSAVTYLLNQHDVDAKRIFVLTSSEGAVHALYYQTHTDVHPFHGMILTGAPGRALNEITNYQVISQLHALPDGADLILRYQQLIKRFEDDLPVSPDPKLPEAVNNLVMALNTPVNQPFSREFWSFRAADYIGKIDVPVLIVIGKKDLQTDWKLDGQVLEKAAKEKKKITFYYPKNANHVLKFEPRPRTELDINTAFQTYNTRDSKLDSPTLQMIVDWLNKNSNSA
jgi:alpha-beta hydrolase superfamily lysophospholipase